MTDNLQPGRELDAEIGEKVLNLEVVERRWGKEKQYASLSIGEPDYYDSAGESILSNPLPAYSTDMAAAWDIVEKMSDREVVFKVWRSPARDPQVWYVELHNHIVEGDTAPHAICKAALMAVGQ